MCVCVCVSDDWTARVWDLALAANYEAHPPPGQALKSPIECVLYRMCSLHEGTLSKVRT